MDRKISLNEPHIILFLNEIQKHGRSIIKLKESVFEVAPDQHDVYLVSGLKQDGNREPILLVSLTEIFVLPFEVLEIDTLTKIFNKV